MGYPHPETPSTLVSAGAATRIASVVLAMLLAVTMLPAAGLSPAFADEPVERPATSGGDVALSSVNGDASEAQAAPVAETREDGMLAAHGLMYTVADGGLALVGFDGEAPEGALTVPAAVSVDGTETPVVAVDLAEGQVADAVTILSLPQGVKDVNTASLAPAFPNLASVEVASAPSSLPVAAGAASVRAAYSASGGMLFRPTSVTVQSEDGLVESIECKELLWAPPALVSARIPVECRAVAEGAFADVRDLKTVVAFGTMERIADGAFSAEQIEAAKVVVPQASAAVTDAERVSASMALMNDAGQKERRSAWHEAGWRTDDIVMGKPYGSLTETLAVTEEGEIESEEAMLVSYPGAHENAMDLKKPNAEGIVEQAENGLAFTVKSDMTAIVTWQGDKTATPSHLDIPSSVVIDGVTYPVTEIAPNAFEGAVFLQSISIPEGVTTIGQDAFKDCPNLAEPTLPTTLRRTAEATPDDASASMTSETNHPAPSQTDVSVNKDTAEHESAQTSVSTYATTSINSIQLYSTPTFDGVSITLSGTLNRDWGLEVPTYYSLSWSGGIIWEPICHGWSGRFDAYRADTGEELGSISIAPPVGWQVASVTVRGAAFAEGLGGREAGFISLVRSEAVGAYPLLTTGSFAGSGSALTAARSDHLHDDRYYTEGEVNGLLDGKAAVSHSHDDRYYTEGEMDDRLNAKLDGSAVSNYNTNAKLDAKFNTKVDASDFGTITYSGLDGSDASVYPTSYRKGGTPALPEPKKEGFRFTGWSWSRGGASGDSSNIADAFAEAGAVTLTANWEESAPEGNCFFADAALDSTAGGAWESVIAVKLTDDASKTSVTGIAFAANDLTGLLADASGVTFAVGSSRDGVSGSYGFGDAPTGSISLADIDGGKGVYVKVSIPAGGIDQDRVVGSKTASDYIASLARMTYQGIA